MDIQATINQHIANLPPDLRMEVLDFVIALERKHSAQPVKKSFIQKLREMPDVGLDEDFERIHSTSRPSDVFD
ncbi:DUF2281 domain-containing protein [Methylomagnum ishizawai]|nr:DUF2281 domain-containing protein [Methylomagnum ishizawai]